jgi:DNA-binding transcriptional regulator LsrR (DeoR family)
VCVVAGPGKLAALQAALRGGFVNELVIDEPSARRLAEAAA